MQLTTVLIPFLVSLITASGLAWVILRWSHLFRVFDKPAEHKIHRTPTPVLGGITIWGGFCLSTLTGLFFMGLGQGPERWIGLLILAAVTALHLLGLFVDICITPAGVKFVGELAVVITFVTILAVKSSVFSHSLLSAIVAGAWMLAITNAINLIDGLDGLAGGITVIACTVFLLMGWHKTDSLAALLAAALAGATAGFLLFNFHPAKLFMGDSGSLLLGFLLATIPLLILDSLDFPTYSLSIPLFVLAIPLIDTSFAFFRRFYQRRSPFSGDLGHTYNKIMDAGLSHKATVLIFYGLSILFGGIGLAIYHKQLPYALVLGALSLGLIAYGTIRYRFLD